jgi:hypothetical protein
MLPHSKRNAITYALYTVDHDETKLAALLGISVEELIDYLYGKKDVPTPVLHKVVDLLLAKTKIDNATHREVMRKIKEARGK